jgi:hypothetical protein
MVTMLPTFAQNIPPIFILHVKHFLTLWFRSEAGLPTQTEKNPLKTPDFSKSPKNFCLKIP